MKSSISTARAQGVLAPVDLDVVRASSFQQRIGRGADCSTLMVLHRRRKADQKGNHRFKFYLGMAYHLLHGYCSAVVAGGGRGRRAALAALLVLSIFILSTSMPGLPGTLESSAGQGAVHCGFCTRQTVLDFPGGVPPDAYLHHLGGAGSGPA